MASLGSFARADTADESLRALVDDEPGRSPRGERAVRIRAYAVAALRAARRGELHHAACLIAEVEAAAAGEGSGHGLERMLVHLARTALHAIDGRDAEAAVELALVQRTAAAEAIDGGLVTSLIRGLGDAVVVTGPDDRRLAVAATIEVPPDAVVIDARRDELVVGGEVVSLRRRSVLRKLLYALARRPGSVLGKDELAEAVWNRPYDPLRHDDALKANVLHLRRLLAGSGFAIVRGDPGYRLEATVRFVFVAPLDLLGGAQRSPGFTGGSWAIGHVR